MESQKFARTLFLIGLFLIVVLPFILRQLIPQVSLAVPASDFFRNSPGIDSLARISSNPTLTALTLGASLTLSVVAAAVILGNTLDFNSAKRLVNGLTASQKFLYSIIAAVVLIVPWATEVDSQGDHQISFQFFTVVTRDPIFLGLFCGGLFVYSVCIIIFIRILAYRGNEK